MWQGLLAGLESVEASRERRQERDFRERQFESSEARAQEQLQMARDTLALNRQKMLASLYPHLKKETGNSSDLAESVSILGGLFGSDSDVVERVLSSGNAAGAKRLATNVSNAYTAAAQQGRGDEFLEYIKNTIINDAVIDPAQTGRMDFSNVNELFGENIEETLSGLGLDLETTTPGSIVFRPPVYQPIATEQDLNLIEKRIAQSAKDMAFSERRNIDKGLAQINIRLQKAGLDPNEEDLLRQSQMTLGERRRSVDEALDLATGDLPVYNELFSLFGTPSLEFATKGPSAVDPERLSPTFTSSLSSVPISVVSESQAHMLYEIGVIKPGDLVLMEGRRFRYTKGTED
jgi:hypothetical protein